MYRYLGTGTTGTVVLRRIGCYRTVVQSSTGTYTLRKVLLYSTSTPHASQLVTMSRSALSATFGRMRSFAKGIAAKEPEFLEVHAILRRAKVRAFVRALDDPLLQDVTLKGLAAANNALAEHAQHSLFPGKEQLQTGVNAALEALSAFRGSSAPILRDPHVDWPLQPDPFAPAPIDIEDSVDQAMKLPHRTSGEAGAAPSAAAGSQPEAPPLQKTTPPNPLDMPEPKDVVLTDEERATLVSMRLSGALSHIPLLWKEMTVPARPWHEELSISQPEVR